MQVTLQHQTTTLLQPTNLEVFRRSAGISQSLLGQRVGKTQTQMSHYETALEPLREGLARRIASVLSEYLGLDVNPDTLQDAYRAMGEEYRQQVPISVAA
jgi:transcriptional regulator with XRE-family HTH domain